MIPNMANNTWQMPRHTRNSSGGWTEWKPWASMPRTGALPCSMTRWPILPRTPASILWPCSRQPCKIHRQPGLHPLQKELREAKPCPDCHGHPVFGKDGGHDFHRTRHSLCAAQPPVANGPENSPRIIMKQPWKKPRDLEEVLQIMGPEVCFDNVNREHWRTRNSFGYPRRGASWQGATVLIGPQRGRQDHASALPFGEMSYTGHILFLKTDAKSGPVLAMCPKA